MKVKLVLLGATSLAVAASLAVMAVYWFGGGFRGPFATDSTAWGNFGDYFGGVLGPVTSFATIVLLVATVLQQELDLNRRFEDSLKQDHVRALADARRDIQFLMERPVTTAAEAIQFGDYVFEIETSDALYHRQFRNLVSVLLQYVTEYSEAYALYRANVASRLGASIHRNNLKRWITFLDKHRVDLRPDELIALDFAKHHFEAHGGP